MMEPVWLWLGLAIFAVSVVFFAMLFKYRIKERKKKQRVRKTSAKSGNTDPREQALYSIDRIIFDLSHSKIDLRESYQRLSMIMRIFVTDISGKDVTSLTLAELNSPELKELPKLIEKWYQPEFAMRTRADFMGDAAQAKRVVKTWK
jgi:hypothetical protein